MSSSSLHRRCSDQTIFESTRQRTGHAQRKTQTQHRFDQLLITYQVGIALYREWLRVTAGGVRAVQRLRNMGKLQCQSPVPSDINIAQAAHPVNISEIAKAAGLTDDEFDLYGTTKAKVAVLFACSYLSALQRCYKQRCHRLPVLCSIAWSVGNVGQAECHSQAC